jgi:hypothetical protein
LFHANLTAQRLITERPRVNKTHTNKIQKQDNLYNNKNNEFVIRMDECDGDDNDNSNSNSNNNNNNN